VTFSNDVIIVIDLVFGVAPENENINWYILDAGQAVNTPFTLLYGRYPDKPVLENNKLVIHAREDVTWVSFGTRNLPSDPSWPKQTISIYGFAIAAAPDAPTSWAVADVNAAIAAGLVPENLQRNYQSNITRGEVAQMFINLLEKASGQTIDDFMAAKGVSINDDAFTDTTDRAVRAANALGIINGVGGGRFDPGGVLTRAHIAGLANNIAKVLGVETEGYTHSFTDVSGHWAEPWLGWPVHAKIIQGVGDNKFDPDGQLTTEMAIMLAYHALAPLSQ
jgi:hypothetical protein